MLCPISIPEYVQHPLCKRCREQLSASDVTAVSLRPFLTDWVLEVRWDCQRCEKSHRTMFCCVKLDAHRWASQIAAAIPSRKCGSVSGDGVDLDEHTHDERSEVANERPEYMAAWANLLHVSSGNADVPEGPATFILTISREDEIEPIAFPLADARTMVTRMLAILAAEDDFAKKLLDENFGAESNGDFRWPTSDDDTWF